MKLSRLNLFWLCLLNPIGVLIKYCNFLFVFTNQIVTSEFNEIGRYLRQRVNEIRIRNFDKARIIAKWEDFKQIK